MGTVLSFPPLKEKLKNTDFLSLKEECINHAVKYFRSALENLIKDKPQYKRRNKLTEAQQKQLVSNLMCNCYA